MKFLVFSISFICLSHLCGKWTCLGDTYSWECLNDYLFTIMCVLNTTSENQPQDIVYYLELCDDRGPHKCTLTEQTYSWRCVVGDTFSDTDSFTISLNSSIHGIRILGPDYMPKWHIRPVPPSNLSMLWEGDQAVFQWLSSYDDDMLLVKNLQYEVSIRTKDKVLNVPVAEAFLMVPASSFAPSTLYSARVRSAPNNLYYTGVWSQWGPAIYWMTTAAQNDSPDTRSSNGWLALLVLFTLPLFGILYHRWKRCIRKPSPIPQIGKIKHFKISSGTIGELLQQEESLKINSMISEPDPHHDICYKNMRDGHNSMDDTRVIMPPSPMGSEVSWAQAFQAEKESDTCSKGYCMLTHLR